MSGRAARGGLRLQGARSPANLPPNIRSPLPAKKTAALIDDPEHAEELVFWLIAVLETVKARLRASDDLDVLAEVSEFE